MKNPAEYINISLHVVHVQCISSKITVNKIFRRSFKYDYMEKKTAPLSRLLNIYTSCFAGDSMC